MCQKTSILHYPNLFDIQGTELKALLRREEWEVMESILNSAGPASFTYKLWDIGKAI